MVGCALVDYIGHSDLYYSIYALFEKRLGYKLFFPEGSSEWMKYLRAPPPGIIVRKIDTDEEMLKFWGVECDNTDSENGITNYHRKMETNAGYYTQRAISFAKFLEMNFDVIITTYKGHEESFCNLVREHKPSAKLIRQINNIGEVPTHCKNALWGMNTPAPDGVNYIRYIPEHYDGYHYTPPPNHNTIKSFMDDLPMPGCHESFKPWNELKALLPDYVFKMHGRDGHDGMLSHPMVPKYMRESAFVWHVKPHGGGGFIPRQALCCGRPTIMRKRYAQYFNELTVQLWDDGVNAIDLDRRGIAESAQMIREWAEPERHNKICKAIAEKASRDMDFAGVAERVRAWIEAMRGGAP